jgi:hypothetical protein
MSESEEFRRYAEETLSWIDNCTDPQERLVLMSLASTWLRAAGRDDHPVVVKELLPEQRVAQIGGLNVPSPQAPPH